MSLPTKIRNVTLIGAGNVNWHIGRVLSLKGYEIRELWSRSESAARELASRIGCRYSLSISDLRKETDLYIVAVRDSGIQMILSELNAGNRLIVHTAGSVPMNVLNGYSDHYGVLYPLQTLSKHIPVNLSEVPFCIESSDEEALRLLRILAEDLSGFVREVNSDQRLLLHIAAVFASNYTNLMYTLASDLLEAEGLSFDFLKPLVAETARKAITSGPSRVQTGPAKRGDQAVLDKHLGILASQPEFAEIYKLLADRIRKRFKA